HGVEELLTQKNIHSLIHPTQTSPATSTLPSIENTANEGIPQCVISIANTIGTVGVKDVKKEVKEEEAEMTQAASAAAAVEVAAGSAEPAAAPVAKRETSPKQPGNIQEICEAVASGFRDEEEEKPKSTRNDEPKAQAKTQSKTKGATSAEEQKRRRRSFAPSRLLSRRPIQAVTAAAAFAAQSDA
ncbi:hypothetical protein PENTCL1PPCAC_5299, partial [Pristionchus entomophagus]